jgi:hypothetical protein
MPFLRSPVLWLGSFATLVSVSTLTSSSSGVQSGLGSFPANCSSALPSCSLCHSGSTPSTTGPLVTITTAGNRRALSQGTTLSVTTAISGGVAGTTGGFVCETTAGTFTGNGTTCGSLGNPAGITHLNNSARSWTYTLTAPTTVGLVSLTSVGNSTNGSSTTGDQFAFSGFDRAATSATPTRLFVLPSSVTNFGSGCADGFGNIPVLGANGTPSVGNTSFAFQMYGLQPGVIGLFWVGINNPGFTGLNMNSLAQNLVASVSLITTGTASSLSQQQRAEGTATVPLAIPNNASLHGLVFDVQGGQLDPTVTAIRTLPLTLTNGLHVVIP